MFYNRKTLSGGGGGDEFMDIKKRNIALVRVKVNKRKKDSTYDALMSNSLMYRLKYTKRTI